MWWDTQFAGPLWLMNSSCRAHGVPRFPFMFKFWTKYECSNCLKFWFQQPLIGRFKQTNGSSHAPTPKVMASRPVQFASYILLLFLQYLLSVRSLTSFLPSPPPPFVPRRSVAASHLRSPHKTLCAACGSVYLITLNKNINLYINLRNLTILLFFLMYPRSSKIDPNLVRTVTRLYLRRRWVCFTVVGSCRGDRDLCKWNVHCFQHKDFFWSPEVQLRNLEAS